MVKAPGRTCWGFFVHSSKEYQTVLDETDHLTKHPDQKIVGACAKNAKTLREIHCVFCGHGEFCGAGALNQQHL